MRFLRVCCFIFCSVPRDAWLILPSKNKPGKNHPTSISSETFTCKDVQNITKISVPVLKSQRSNFFSSRRRVQRAFALTASSTLQRWQRHGGFCLRRNKGTRRRASGCHLVPPPSERRLSPSSRRLALHNRNLHGVEARRQC